MSLVVYLNSVNSTNFDQPMYTVIHMQDPGSVRVNQDPGSLASRVGSRVTSLPGRVGSQVSVADPVPSLTVSTQQRGPFLTGGSAGGEYAPIATLAVGLQPGEFNS